MGLDIIGKKTENCISSGYSKLHHNARFLALFFCGMPLTIGKENDDRKDIDSFVFFMHPFTGFNGVKFEIKEMQKYNNALIFAGFYFPNLLMHSDCDGNYTKNGPTAIESYRLLKGNSIQLLKELNLLCNDKYLKEMAIENERIKCALDYTVSLRNLVKDEIENGCGTILFR